MYSVSEQIILLLLIIVIEIYGNIFASSSVFQNAFQHLKNSALMENSPGISQHDTNILTEDNKLNK
jgi:hypothetical protein